LSPPTIIDAISAAVRSATGSRRRLEARTVRDTTSTIIGTAPEA
jgi:hypothetical protein